jgi:hypothetical protein
MRWFVTGFAKSVQAYGQARVLARQRQASFRKAVKPRADSGRPNAAVDERLLWIVPTVPV